MLKDTGLADMRPNWQHHATISGMTELPSGVYKHYKGGLYLLLGLAEHTETGERLVVYVPLGVRSGPRLQARPLDMFHESVTVGGILKPRFVYIGSEVDPVFSQFYDPLSGYQGGDRVDN